MVKVHNSKGIANRTGPESCGAHREMRDEALTGEPAGQPLSRESNYFRVTHPGEGTEDTKRRASMQELLSLSGNSRAEEEIIQKLANASLLTTDRDLTHKDALWK